MKFSSLAACRFPQPSAENEGHGVEVLLLLPEKFRCSWLHVAHIIPLWTVAATVMSLPSNLPRISHVIQIPGIITNNYPFTK